MANDITSSPRERALIEYMMLPGVRKAMLDNYRLGDGNAERISRSVLMAVRVDTSGKLLECTPSSIIATVLTALQYGLEVNPHAGMAYLLPYDRKCTLVLGYRGMIQLAYRNARILNVGSAIVYDGDDYSWGPADAQQVTHRPVPPSKRGPSYVAAYSRWDISGGGRHYEWLWREEVEARRNKSPAWNRGGGPWVAYPDAMIRKTTIRAAAGHVPWSAEQQAVLAVDETEPTLEPKDTMAGDILDEIAAESGAPSASAERVDAESVAQIGDLLKGLSDELRQPIIDQWNIKTPQAIKTLKASDAADILYDLRTAKAKTMGGVV